MFGAAPLPGLLLSLHLLGFTPRFFLPCLPSPQFHRNQDYPVTRPTLFLRQFLHAASRLVVTVGADPMTEDEALNATEEQLEAAAQR